jgi:Cof subfamily protein (haloacid dehalogenase superfamily)
MWRSVRPYLEEAGITDLTVCYQGAAVIDPRRGQFVLHEPIPLETAREAIAFLATLGHSPNCYVDDRLYVDKHTEYSRMYAGFQHIPVEEVGDLTVWLERPPTKLVAVAEPAEIPALREAMVEAFGERLFLTTSLPYLLEIGNPAVSKGTGIAFVARELGISLDRIVSFGDGENDIELIEEAGFGIAVEDANPLLLERADWICPSANAEGVATVIDAYLESLP